ncbi:TetR/AcrR family transcriptional regulator [Pseudorhizobium marinum]|uniref:TetR/AcrR family transcriptional regulator n=1 Tax=Pseudorhizobium marinum TaxID=1496690 RepID=UPI0004975B77|nr:TetR/AcrR family transcriptional regulator [Pseudorhizobium marinum]
MNNGAQTRIARSRTKILAAASDVFLSEGYVASSMEQVALAADVSIQTIYSHFKGKGALFLEVATDLAGGAASAVGNLVETLPEDTPVEEWLTRFATQQLKVVLTPTLMQLRRMVIGEVGRFPQLGRTLYEAGPGRAIARLTTGLQHYIERGEIAMTDPVRAAKQFNWLLMGGPTSEVMYLGEAAIPTEPEMRTQVDETVAIFLAAYGREATPPASA